MPEFRQDWATKEWVIIATERAKRPEDFKQSAETRKPLPPNEPDCPFCLGNEDRTPPSVFSLEDDGGWALRVVPNKFAALQPDLTTMRKKEGKFLRVDGFGVAEVLIETPLHNVSPALMSHKAVEKILIGYRSRYHALATNSDISLITIFRNHGPKAGTSLEHPHSQIIATPIVPPHVRDQITKAMLSCDTYGRCIYCDVITEEIRQQARVVAETDHFLLITPFASRYPFEMRIYPKRHSCNFGGITDQEIVDLSAMLKQALYKFYLGLGNPDYNYIIRSGPTDDIDVKHFHWYIELLPKLTTPAGFELGTGIFINVALPEGCARYLRELPLSE